MSANGSYLEKCFGLKGKAALVTGASGGIGRALAAGLAGAGASVVLHGRSASQLAEVQRQIESSGGRAVSLCEDLSDSTSCRRLVDASTAAFGRLDILINCAGMNRRKPIEETSEQDFDDIVNVNLRSIFFLSQAAHSIMRAQGGGKIVHVASLTSSMALGETAVYGLTKAALAQLAKTQAVEWARDNIQVNCLAPGFVLTPLTEGPLWGDPKKREWLLGRIPAARPGSPEEMVAPMLLLVAPGASYLTGQMITVDGGVLAGGSWDQPD